MKLLLIHLSDIHFHSEKNSIASNVHQLLGPIRASLMGVHACVVVVTGDLAFSGKGDEYELATSFLQELADGIRASKEGLPVYLILVPGNHDCSFGGNPGLRDPALIGIRAKPESIATGDVSFFDAMLIVQSSFFLYESMQRDGTELTGTQRLYWERLISVGDETILFRCFNTAWMSEMKEQQGQLYYPLQFLPHEHSTADLIVGLMHHPYNWFVNQQARALRHSIEETCDVILTGHEHVPELYMKAFSLDNTNTYVEGGVLQSDQLEQSSFHTLIIDTEEQTFRGTTWSSHRDEYISQVNPTVFAFRRNQRARADFSVTQAFETDLADPGTPFTHRRKRDLRLRDIFVYPDLTNRSFDRARDDDANSAIKGSRIHTHLDEHADVLIFGPESAGKTTLAKILFEDLKNRGMVPVLLDGRKLNKPWEESQFDDALTQSVGYQYGEEAIQRYRQLDLKLKVLLIDNIEHAALRAIDIDIENLGDLSHCGGLS